MAENDDLFGNLESTMSFLQDRKEVSKDGLYRVDLKKLQDKTKPYKATIRFLPNFRKDGKIGDSAIEKVTHYVDIKQLPELCGYYDSAKNPSIQKINPGAKCPLSETYYSMTNSKNATLVEKAKMLKYSKKYFSYIQVIDDPNQPELNGKVLIFQYGKTIRDKINSEKTGEVSGESCTVFNLHNGKDFVLLVKEIDTGEDKYPDYKNCSFKPNTSSIMLPSAAGLKNVPLEDSNIPDKFKSKIKEYLVERDTELETYEPKILTEEQQAKVSQIISYLTGKSIASGFQSKPVEASSSDFDFDDLGKTSTKPSKTTDVDDEFDFNI